MHIWTWNPNRQRISQQWMQSQHQPAVPKLCATRTFLHKINVNVEMNCRDTLYLPTSCMRARIATTNYRALQNLIIRVRLSHPPRANFKAHGAFSRLSLLIKQLSAGSWCWWSQLGRHFAHRCVSFWAPNLHFGTKYNLQQSVDLRQRRQVLILFSSRRVIKINQNCQK